MRAVARQRLPTSQFPKFSGIRSDRYYQFIAFQLHRKKATKPGKSLASKSQTRLPRSPSLSWRAVSTTVSSSQPKVVSIRPTSLSLTLHNDLLVLKIWICWNNSQCHFVQDNTLFLMTPVQTPIKWDKLHHQKTAKFNCSTIDVQISSSYPGVWWNCTDNV